MHNEGVKLPENPRETFYLLQVGLGVVFVWVAWKLFRGREPQSGFRVREADRRKGFRPREKAAELGSDLGRQKKPKTTPPLQIEGIRIDGKPHEILGISENASKKEIQAAYMACMKRYHPDQVGRPGSREWIDAQKIAAALNQARNELLARLRN